MLRAYRDTFQTKVWDYWRKEDFSGLYRYLFGGARLVPGPAEGTPGSGLRVDAQVNQVLYLKAAGVIGGDAGFVYDAATNIGTIGGLIVSGATAAGKAMVRRTATQYLDLWGDASAEWIAAISADTAKKPLNIFNLQATQTIGFGIGAAALANLQLMISDGAAYPYVTNDLDLGLSSRLFKDAYAYRFLHQAGAVGTPSVAATNDLHTGLFWPADHAVGVSLGGAEYLRFSISGGHCLLTLS